MEKHEIRLGMAVEFDPADELIRLGAMVTDPRAKEGGTRPPTRAGLAWRSRRSLREWHWASIEQSKVVGHIVGTRTLQEGYTEHHYEEPSVWMQTGTTEAVLVAVNLRHEPKKFPARDLTEAP
jgi:hypothetical protein